jgi:hypothetical protein
MSSRVGSRVGWFAGLCAGAAALLAARDAAAACNPYKVNFAVVAPPRVGPLPLYYNIASTCPGKSVSCPGILTPGVSASTTIQQKCTMLATDIMNNPACNNLGAHFAVDATNCGAATAPSFSVTDACTNTTTPGGVYFGIANFAPLLKPLVNQTGFVFGDYENDLIAPDCAETSGPGHAVILDGTSSGSAIVSGNSTSSVVASVDLTSRGAGTVFGGTNTTPGETAEAVVSAVVAQLAVSLSLSGTGVTCAQPAGKPRVIECTEPSTPSGAALASASTTGIALGLQVDDTGLSRADVAGFPTVVQQVVATVDTQSAPSFEKGVVLSAPPSVPALGTWGLLALALLIAAAGVRLVARRATAGSRAS